MHDDRGRFNLGVVATQMQYTDNVLQSHILETYVILLTNVIPINLIKNRNSQHVLIAEDKSIEMNFVNFIM